MLFSIIIVVLILAIAYLQASQGWFSAMIMAVLTLTCGALALGAHEWLAVNYLAPYWKRDYAHAIALAALFGIPLIILRLLFDRLIRRTSLLPAMIDRIGGGICGFVTAMVMVGVFAYTVQLLPFDKGSILGFSRVDVADPATEKPSGFNEQNLWLSPDRFAAAAATMLTAGVFGDSASLYQDHPDFVQEAGWTNSAPAGVSRYAEPGSISVTSTELIAEMFRVNPGDRNNPTTYDVLEPPPPDKEFRLVRFRLGEKARDERKSHLFTLRQFRLAGRRPGSSALMEYHAVGIQQEDANDPTNRYIRARKGRVDMPVVDMVYSPRSGETVEVVFEVPKGFQPTHASYKRGARTPVSLDESQTDRAERPPARADPERTAASTPPPAPATSGGRRPRGENVPSTRTGGNIRGVTTKSGRSFFGDDLPIELKSYRGTNIDQQAGTLASGSLVAELDKQDSGTDPPLRKFRVPDDKRLLQLSMSKLQARSGIGRILSQVVTTVQNYFVEDDSGRRYEVVGKYAVADVNGTGVLELQYFGGSETGAGRLQAFDRIKDSHLQGDYGFVLLFLVEPGAKITGFSSGGDAARADDLTEENLAAPP